MEKIKIIVKKVLSSIITGIIFILIICVVVKCNTTTTVVITDDKNQNELTIKLRPGEKFIDFSIGLEDHTLWIATKDTSGGIHIIKVKGKGGFPFENGFEIKEN